MKPTLLSLFSLLLLGLSAPALAETRPEQIVSASVVVKVTQRDTASKAVIDESRRLGGYFSELSAQRVVLRVPAEKVEALVASAAAQGVLVDRAFSRQDRAFELNDQRSRLRAREEMLDQYLALLDEASPDAVLTVEQQIVALVSEIERLKGAIRYLEHQVDFGRVEVSFQFRDRQAPTRGGSSSFSWLNTLNLQDLVEGFRYNRRGGRYLGPAVSTPALFAPYRSRAEYRATSPDGVLFRVRTVEHEPQATLAFWREAMKKRMIDAGYRVLSESDLSAGSRAGTLLELTAPLGTDDYTYLVALFPDDGKLVIVEAAGEVARFAARREPILASIRALSF